MCKDTGTAKQFSFPGKTHCIYAAQIQQFLNRAADCPWYPSEAKFVEAARDLN
ncbi:hypothetical protein ES703_98227 [subsurface metagenome]